MDQVGYNSVGYFGTGNDAAFCELKMARILADDNGGIDACKRYFLSKVAILSNGDFAVYSGKKFWRVENPVAFNRVKLKAKESAERARARVVAHLPEGVAPGKIERWDVRSWVASSTIKTCRVAFDPARPLIYMTGGECWLNAYTGRLHALDIPEFAAAPEEAREAVNLFLNHLKMAVCSGEVETFKYLKLWTAAVEAGQKTSKQLWIHSTGQGIGKSLYGEILRKHIIGANMFEFQAGATRAVLGDFNEALAKKIVVLFDDPAISNLADAKRFESGLKSITTASTIKINPKGMAEYEIENSCNFIVTSNFPAFTQSSGVRRTVFITGDSAKYAQEEGKIIDGLPYADYYQRLYDATEVDGFGQALVAHLREFMAENPTWTPAKMPANAARADAVVRSAPLFVRFLIDRFLTPTGKHEGAPLYTLDINKTTAATMRKIYAEYCKDNGVVRIPGAYEATKKLKEIDASFGDTYGSHRYFKATTQALLKKLAKFVEHERWVEMADCVSLDFLRKSGCPPAVMAKISGKAAEPAAAAAAAAEPAAAAAGQAAQDTELLEFLELI